MIRALIRLILLLWFGQPTHPSIKNLRHTTQDTLYLDSLTRGLVITGNPGTGKTTWAAMELYRYAVTYPDRPIFVYDPSRATIKDFFEIHYSASQEDFNKVDWRIVYDRVGDENFVVPKPIFSSNCGLTDEEMVQRAVNILEELNVEVIERNPTMSFAIKEIWPELLRIINVTRPPEGRWQITEARKFLLELDQLEKACKRFGGYAGGAKYFFEKDFLNPESKGDRNIRAYTLRSALGVIEPKSLRARYGYNPRSYEGYTEKEAIEKGLIVLLDMSPLANQPKAQAWAMWDSFTSLKALINKRIPHDPTNVPVLVLFDETYQAYDVKGMSKELGRLYSYFRSRGLMPAYIIQAFWQLDEKLAQQIWGHGNFVSFAMEDFNDAYKIAQQLFKYDPTQEKRPAASERGQPILETDRGEYLTQANWIQRLEDRQMLMRRYVTEQKKEDYIYFVERTREKPPVNLRKPLEEIELEYLKRRAVSVDQALEEVNNRQLTLTNQKRRTLKKA